MGRGGVQTYRTGIKGSHFPLRRISLIAMYGAKTTNSAAQNQKAINKAIATCSRKAVDVHRSFRHLRDGGSYHAIESCQSGCREGCCTGSLPRARPLPHRSHHVGRASTAVTSSPCIYAYKQTDIAVTGEGIVDGSGVERHWWPWNGNPRFGFKEGRISQRGGSRARLLKNVEDGVPMDQRIFTEEDGLRPQLINFYLCENILMENLTLLNSPFWVIHPLLSKNITVRGMKIINDGPNGDGCDPESCDGVLIENCFFNTGDDCIAIKSGRNNDGRLWDKPSENIIIRNCEMKNGHGGVVIGSEISGGCRNVYAENNVMDSPELERVVRIKTNTCRGGVIENINARNIKVGVCKESVLKINLDYEPREICCRGFVPTVRNVNIENITCEKSKYGVQIIALDSVCNVYDINVKDCHFNGVKDGNYSKGQTRDVHFDNLFINGSLVLQQMPYQHYSEWLTYSEMKRVPKSYLLDFSTKPKWSYDGIELEGMLDTYLRYGGEDILKYCKEYTDTMIYADGNIRGFNILDYNLDNIRTRTFRHPNVSEYPEQKNLLAMQLKMKQLRAAPPSPTRCSGTKPSGLPGVARRYFHGTSLPHTDCSHHTANLSRTPRLQKAKADKRYQAIYDDAVNQLKITISALSTPSPISTRHAYDETRKTFWADKETGLSQHCWGRAQGWYTMALVEVLDALPEDYTRRGS